eukprot:CAMPEP_0185156930 /NCGR_PEP_ID=MMETSP1139-20130426/1439_1 /TAXON_ID=298111 /ORGANISM="Pavlova sp., Strain CCMP459" /LENGTH=86 /DNA_ID=CAMNT_0027721967 /DNA_START=667 /DNA_END=924 /DNA_ORIENTATION=+
MHIDLHSSPVGRVFLPIRYLRGLVVLVVRVCSTFVTAPRWAAVEWSQWSQGRIGSAAAGPASKSCAGHAPADAKRRAATLQSIIAT